MSELGGMNATTAASTGMMLQTLMYLVQQNMSNTLINTLKNTTEPNPEEVCYGVYGCFSIAGPWTVQSHRPINCFPESPYKMNVRFPVFTRNSRSYPKFIDINDPDDVADMGINPQGKIYFVAHGYIDSGDRPWVQTMVNALLDADEDGTTTVLVVDWGGGSSPPYTQAAANIRLVGAITAHIIYLLYEELEMKNLDNVHLIGHSLGSHLSGYCGMTLQRDFHLQLGRITGMDPAEPLFAHTDPVVRLDRTDAKFVDVIHSDASSFVSELGLGLFEPIGHVDFYPNGGSLQPGCNENMKHYIDQHDGSFFYGIQNMVACNHIRSIQFFTESILSQCPFTAISCDSYEDFKNGYCFDCNRHDHFCMQFGLKSYESYRRFVNMGYIKDSRPISLFFLTNDQPPFCKTHYKITARVSSDNVSTLHGGEFGKLSVKIHGKHNVDTEKMPFSAESVYFEPGYNYTSVIPGNDAGRPQYATLEWVYKMIPINPLTWRIFNSPRIYISYILVESLEHRSIVRLCPIFSEPVVQGQEIDFRASNCDHLPADYY